MILLFGNFINSHFYCLLTAPSELMPAGRQGFQYFLNILYWFEERRNTTDNESLLLNGRPKAPSGPTTKLTPRKHFSFITDYLQDPAVTESIVIL